MNLQKAKVSVILPVYNAEKYVFQAIESILEQSFDLFELIIIDDGSSDKSDEIIKGFHDERIIYHSRENKGLTFTLNELAELANCELIARMDADDISHPDRLKLQYEEFNSNDKLVLVSTNVSYINEKGEFQGSSLSVSSDFAVRAKLKKGNIIFHPTTMFKKQAFLVAGKYPVFINKYVEDYVLWMSMLQHGNVKVLKGTLLSYRVHDGAISSNVPDLMPELVKKIADNQGEYAQLENDYKKMINGTYTSVVRINGYVFSDFTRKFVISFLDFLYCMKIKK